MSLSGVKNAKRNSKAIEAIDKEIKGTRAFISKWVVKKERLCLNRRLTKRTKRNCS